MSLSCRALQDSVTSWGAPCPGVVDSAPGLERHLGAALPLGSSQTAHLSPRALAVVPLNALGSVFFKFREYRSEVLQL